jgi:two-component system cell cycle sensor histidine kinase/response regulator CckA
MKSYAVLRCLHLSQNYRDEPAYLILNIEKLQKESTLTFYTPDTKERVEALHEASFFRALIEYTRDPVYVLDPKDGYRMLYVNEAACRHFGMDREHLLTLRIADWDPVFDMENIDAMWDELKKGKSMRFETLHRIASGKLVPVDVTVNYLVHEGREYSAGYFQNITERKAMEAALKESEQNLITAQRIARVGNWVRDLSGNLISASAELYRIFGVSHEEFPGSFETLADFAHPEDRDRVSSTIENFLRNHLPYSVEYRITLPNGDNRIVLGKGEVVFDDQGKPSRMVGIAQDLTELRRVESALRKSEERYALAVQATNDGIWDVDFATGEVYFSPRWKSMLGYEDYEIPNDLEEWKKRLHPDDFPKIIEARTEYLEGRTPLYEVEYRLRHKDGSYCWVLSRGACVRDSQGIPYRFSGSHIDITKRMTLEHALRESEKKYRDLFEESKNAISIVDVTGRITDMNPAGAELLGYTREELLSMSFANDFGILPAVSEELLKTLSGCGFVNDFELELRRKDGRKVVVHFSATVTRDESGNITGYRGIAHDISEHKRLERQLMQAQKMESIGILAGGVAHDFNNILTAISGYGETIRDNIPADNGLLRESVEQVLRAADRAAELTKSLLAFSRKQLLRPRQVEVGAIIRNTSKLISRLIGEDIELSTSFSDRKLPVMADTGQIEQVLMNLAANARDAMPNGGWLHVSTRQVIVHEGSEARYDLAKPGKYVRISISDNGVGIEKKYLGRIFEPFFTTKEVGKGTGLGLAMAYGAVKQHDGSIVVKSRPGNGTTFSIYLPVEGDNDAVREKQPETVMPTPGGTETLLIAEDEEMVRSFMKKAFERAGYRVIAADDGEDALEKFRENMKDISLILSDVIMPKKNGREILEEVKRIKPGIKVIFISGYTANVMHEKGILGQDTDIVTKPFLKDDLLRKVREVLDKD